jgi:hypothetical protein
LDLNQKLFGVRGLAGLDNHYRRQLGLRDNERLGLRDKRRLGLFNRRLGFHDRRIPRLGCLAFPRLTRRSPSLASITRFATRFQLGLDHSKLGLGLGQRMSRHPTPCICDLGNARVAKLV